MSKIWNGFCDWFSETGWFFLFIGLMIIATVSLIAAVATAENKREARAKTCYSRGMIVAKTDAGYYCADPKTLIELKEAN